MTEYTKKNFFRKSAASKASAPSGSDAAASSGSKKKPLIVACCIVCAVLAAYLAFGQELVGIFSGTGNVKFTCLTDEEIPRTIEKDVIPEYRDLERALGCLVDGKVYIVVTRGEKPTAGYDISIEKVKLEKTKSGSNLVVTALFTEPPEGETVSRIITYPYAVASTDLEALPDTIELNVRYA